MNLKKDWYLKNEGGELGKRNMVGPKRIGEVGICDLGPL